MTEEVARVRLDLNARIERLESERRSKEELYSRISTLEKELSGQSVCTINSHIWVIALIKFVRSFSALTNYILLC